MVQPTRASIDPLDALMRRSGCNANPVKRNESGPRSLASPDRATAESATAFGQFEVLTGHSRQKKSSSVLYVQRSGARASGRHRGSIATGTSSFPRAVFFGGLSNLTVPISPCQRVTLVLSKLGYGQRALGRRRFDPEQRRGPQIQDHWRKADRDGFRGNPPEGDGL